jgi:hypothetical protein
MAQLKTKANPLNVCLNHFTGRYKLTAKHTMHPDLGTRKRFWLPSLLEAPEEPWQKAVNAAMVAAGSAPLDWKRR